MPVDAALARYSPAVVSLPADCANCESRVESPVTGRRRERERGGGAGEGEGEGAHSGEFTVITDRGSAA